jgi:P4 family phage/plasmid primase-like protien
MDYSEELVKMHTVKEVVNNLLSDLEYTAQEDLNADENIINFQNGLLKINGDRWELIPHSPEVLSTIQIPCNWIAAPIPTPVFDQYIFTLTNGDPEVIELLLQYIGACISNIQGWRMKKTLFLVGSGNTGKSQLKSLTEKLLGRGNYIGIDLSEIEARFGTGAIYGKRLAGSSDMSFMSINEIKTLKRISGGDNIHAEFKGQQSFVFTYRGLTWFCMNRLPKFSGDTGQWVYDRLIVINCPNVIPFDKQDKQLLDKMYAEREGIVQKAIAALQRVIANGYRFAEPSSVKDARIQYQKDNSTVITFFEDCMCPWPDGKATSNGCTTGKIHTAYREWCKRNNNGHFKSAKEFRDELAGYLFTTFADMSTRIRGNTFYKDYTLTQEAQEDLLY